MLSNGTNSVIEAAVYSAMSPGVNYITGCMIYKAISLAAGSSSQQVNNFTV